MRTTATLSSAGCGSCSMRARAPCSASASIVVLPAAPLPAEDTRISNDVHVEVKAANRAVVAVREHFQPLRQASALPRLVRSA